MNSQQLLFINFIIFVAIVLYFTLGRSKPKQPVRLNLAKAPEPAAAKKEARPAREVGPRKEKVQLLASSPIFFMYNGHEWEAHEVLGLKSEWSLPEMTAQYQNLIRTADPSSFEFYDAAFSAILKKKNG